MGYCTSSKDSYASRITGAGYGGAHSLFQFRGEPPIQAYSTIYLFSVALASGVVTVLPLVPGAIFGRRFFLLVGLVGILFYGLGMLSQGLGMEPFFLLSAGFLILYEITLPPHPDGDKKDGRGTKEKANHNVIAGAASNASLALAIVSAWVGVSREAWQLPGNIGAGAEELAVLPGRVVVLLSLVSASLLIGFSLGSMILGHWYLVSRKLSFRPLKLITGLLCFLVIFRLGVILLSASSQGVYWSKSFSGGMTHYLLRDGLLVACRLGLGILLPGALAFLAWRCAKIESNQSATGILYVLVAFVFFGEILSKHFLAHQGVVL